MLGKDNILLHIALIIFLGFAVYSSSLSGKFIWDDNILVKDNRYIRSWSGVGRLLAGDVTSEISRDEFDFYRPFQIISYMVDYSLWKLDVRGYHLTNILLHISVALAVYWLIYILFGDMLVSLLTAIFFIVHPLHIAAVTYISGRSDSLAALFLLLAFIFYLRLLESDRKRFYAFMILAYMAALLSREASFILPGLLVLYHYSFGKKIRAGCFLPFLIVTLAHVLLRFVLLGDTLGRSVFPTTFLQRLPGFFAAITDYIRVLIVPSGLHMEYLLRLFRFNDPSVVTGILILVFLLICAARKRRERPLVSFSILWFFIAILPVSNLYPLRAYMAEHWLYVPSIGAFLIMAKGLAYLYRRKGRETLTFVCITVVLCFYSYSTIKHNAYWREPLVFFERTLKYAPESARLYANLGNEYYFAGKKEKAIYQYEKAIELDPEFLDPYFNLGTIYAERGSYDEAIVFYKKALEIDAEYEDAYFDLAIIYFEKKEHDMAIEYCDRAIEHGFRAPPEFLEALALYRR